MNLTFFLLNSQVKGSKSHLSQILTLGLKYSILSYFFLSPRVIYLFHQCLKLIALLLPFENLRM